MLILFFRGRGVRVPGEGIFGRKEIADCNTCTGDKHYGKNGSNDAFETTIGAQEFGFGCTDTLIRRGVCYVLDRRNTSCRDLSKDGGYIIVPPCRLIGCP